MSPSKDKVYRRFSASLRIFGESLDFEGISAQLGLTPTHSHRRGDRRAATSPPFELDGWVFEVPVARERRLEEHLVELWRLLRPHVAYLKILKRTCAVDIFCGYRSNSDTAGFSVAPSALTIFTELDIPFGLSVIIV